MLELERTSAEGMQATSDTLDALVYVSDFDSHELLYMNAYGRLIWSDIGGRSQVNVNLPCR